MAQKVELTWMGKGERCQIDSGLMIENPDLSYGDLDSENMLIQGDNLSVLKALEAKFTEKIKCIYIDPPYNTGSAFEHYDDNLENSQWLNFITPRLKQLKKLLSKDGFIAVQIDDNQYARLCLVMMEIFGERNLKTICVKMSEPTGVKMASINKSKGIAKLKEYIIIAGIDGVKGLDLERIPKDRWDKEYKTLCEGVSEGELRVIKRILDDDQRTAEDIASVKRLCQKISFISIRDFFTRENIKRDKESWLFDNAWRIIQVATVTGGAKDIAVSTQQSFGKRLPSCFPILTKRKKMYLIKGGFNVNTPKPRSKILFADKYLSVHAGDLWTDIKTTGLDNEGCVDFPKGKKPERLLYRIIQMLSKKNDWVLDSFLGSGTTAAVAHKMGRKWIGIELGAHVKTHCVRRLNAVIDGEKGGISSKVNWQGGGGYHYYQLTTP